MSSNLNRPLKFIVNLSSEHPNLLQGLDEWLRLGLISDAEVRLICEESLICQVTLEPQAIPKKQNQQVFIKPSKPAVRRKVTAAPNFVSTMWQSLRAEFSVRWLLFLGMFTVVVSSGALAASQWARFTPLLQYGVLFAYTLGFWGLSFTTSKQRNLRLTSGALHIVAMLLIPINFWAMDSFSLWQNPISLLLIGIAAIILTAITTLLCKQQIFTSNIPVTQLSLINILGLSYLHLGWKFPGFSLIAVYFAVVGTAIITIFQKTFQKKEEVESQEKSRLSQLWGKNLPTLVIIYASMLLLLRAIFGVGVNVENLGLAIGICGWLIAWLGQKETKKKEQISTSSSPSVPIFPYQTVGAILLFIGWYTTVETNPWQAIAVSGLGLWFFNSRLNLYSLKRDLATFFIVGLQSTWLAWRLLPAEFQSSIVTTATRLTNAQDNPWALLGVGLFPYIIFMVAFTDNLRSRNKILLKSLKKISSHQPSEPNVYIQRKIDLANFGETITLILGINLNLITLLNPTLRSLNLLLSTITLAVVTYQHFNKISSPPSSPSSPSSPSPPSSPSSPSLLTYLTHTTATLTLFSWINLFFPSLTAQSWAVVCLVLMVAEWLFSVGDGIWRRSAWHIGLALAGLSYCLFWTNVGAAWEGIRINFSAANWGLAWLVTPITLTMIASRSTQRKVNQQNISILTIIFAQFLTLPLSGTRLIALIVGAVVMFVNTRYLKNEASALTTVGFSLSVIAATAWEYASLSYASWFILNAVIILCLWIIRKVLQRGNELANIYAIATDLWAIFLCLCELLLLTLHAISVYLFAETNILFCAISAVITIAALSFRHFYEPRNLTFYSIGWGVELLELYAIEIFEFGVYEITSQQEPRLIYLAIANIALGLITQLFGEWLEGKYHPVNLPNRWHILPLLYATFGLLLRWSTFEDWTGLSTLAVALIVIGVGRRNQKFKPILYLGIIGVSIAAYELLFYQLMQASGGAVGDGFIVLATLATVIAYTYRLLGRWLTSYLRISRQELNIFAHCHWALASILLISVIGKPMAAYGLALVIGLLLSCYAILQGRYGNELASQPIRRKIIGKDIWIYLGLIEVTCLRYFLPDTLAIRLFLEQIHPWQAAVSCIIAYLLYILPWENWRWSKEPWQNAAYVIPLISLWETRIEVYSISLLFTAGYYLFIAKIKSQFRFTYISLVLFNWALWRWFIDLNLTDALWYISSIGCSLIYIAEFDWHLKLPQNKIYRHSLRILGAGIICGYAALFHQNTFLIPGILSLIAIFSGLALKVRAFLSVGTVTFLITSFYHLVLFTLDYPFLKWVVGLIVGMTLIFIAANFESRRQQLNSLLRNIHDEFREWE